MTDENKQGSLRDILGNEIKAEASSALKLEMDGISLTKAIRTYGIDSVSASEITHHFSEKYHLPLTPTLFFEVRNFNEYIDYLLKQFSTEIESYYQDHKSSTSSSDDLKPEGPLIVGSDDQNVSHVSEKANAFDAIWSSLQDEQNANLLTEENPSIQSDSKIVAIGNDIIEFVSVGKGEPVLLIGGLGNDFLIWEKCLPSLSLKNELLIYYPPGHGKSTLVHGLESLEPVAHFLKKGLESLGIANRIPLVAHSSGACIALVFAALYPESVQSLTIISASAEGRVSSDSFEHIAKEFEKVARRVSHASALMPFSSGAIMEYYKPILGNFNIKPILSKITCPVIIFCGKEDEYVTSDHSEELHDLIVNSKLVSIEHGGHFLLLTHSEEILKEITFP